MQDKIKYLRIILTEECNLNCCYCHKEGCDKSNKILSKENIIKLINCFYKIGINKFKFMGGEPTLRLDLIDILYEIRNLKDIDSSIITNGLFSIDTVEKYFEAGLKRVNVSVHGWSDEKKLKLIGMSQEKKEKFLLNLDYLLKKNKLNKINYVFLKNDSREEIINLINWINEKKIVLDILNVLYSPKNENLKREYCTFEEIYNFLKKNYKIYKECNWENLSSIPSKRIFLKEGGIINLKINTLNQIKPFNSCKNCRVIEYCKEGIKAIRLTTDGYLKPCLFRDDNKLNLIEHINKNEDELSKVILNYINNL